MLCYFATVFLYNKCKIIFNNIIIMLGFKMAKVFTLYHDSFGKFMHVVSSNLHM